jgi:hypothetical protein
MAYRRLVGEEIADWLGPEQGRIDVPTRYEDRRFKPMTLDHVQHEMSDYVYVRTPPGGEGLTATAALSNRLPSSSSVGIASRRWR